MIHSRPEPKPTPAKSPVAELAEDLRRHWALCQEILAVVERENQWFRQAEPAHAPSCGPDRSGLQGSDLSTLKKSLLARLNQSLDRLRKQRQCWQQLPPAERVRYPEIASLLRQNQDLIMKVIMLDRENEQALLRRGLIPAAQLPPAQRQRPHFVSELYRHQGARFT